MPALGVALLGLDLLEEAFRVGASAWGETVILIVWLVEAVEAGEPVGEHARADLDVAGRIVTDRLLREPRHDAQMRIDRMAVTGRDGDDERELVRRTSPRLSGLSWQTWMVKPSFGTITLPCCCMIARTQ